MAAPSRGSQLLGRLDTVLGTLITLGLAGIGAAAGFRHTHDWAVSNGQLGWFAWADAVVIECMCLVAGFEIHKDRKAGRSARFPLTVLMIGFLIQMTAQVAEAKPTPAGWLLAATPALGFLVVVKLLMRRLPAGPPANAELAREPLPASPMPPVTAASEPPEVTAPQRPALTSGSQLESEPGQPDGPPVKLPADVAARVNAAITAARDEGRAPSVEDVQRVARIPAHLARRVLTTHTT